MVRAAKVIADETPLVGAKIDVNARIGWLLRTSRMTAGVLQDEMSRRLARVGVPLSGPSISQIETQGRRNGRLIDAYEEALELDSGRLRAPIDMVCANFPYAPTDAEPGFVLPTTLAEFDALMAPVLDGKANGGQWLRAARCLSSATGWPLPTQLIRGPIDLLRDELVRSVDLAYQTRYLAILHLRRSIYGGVVEQSVRDMVDDPGAAIVMLNALVAVAEEPSVSMMEWMAGLLTSDSPFQVAGAAFGLQNMATVRGSIAEADWMRIVPAVVAACDHAEPGSINSRRLSSMLMAMPPSMREAVEAGVSRPPTPVDRPASWAADPSNRHYLLCDEAARRVVALFDDVHQPLLTRVIFELVYDPRVVRVAAAAELVTASPYRLGVQQALIDLSLNGPDAVTRRGAIRALHFSSPTEAGGLAAWFEQVDVEENPACLLVAANAGLHVPDSQLDLVRDDSETSLRVLEWMGMSQSPLLAAVAADPTRHPVVRAGARWWMERGGRVTS